MGNVIPKPQRGAILHDAEMFRMLEARNEALTDAMVEIDYLISYGQILEARTLIETLCGDVQAINNQKGIKNVKK